MKGNKPCTNVYVSKSYFPYIAQFIEKRLSILTKRVEGEEGFIFLPISHGKTCFFIVTYFL